MCPSVEISSLTFKRLQVHAVALVDNPESVIKRLIDFYEEKNGVPSSESVVNQIVDCEETKNDASSSAPDKESESPTKIFPPSAPPNLRHTKIFAVKFCNETFNHSQLNWNSLLFAAIEKAKSLAKSSSELKRLVIVNVVEREKVTEGYRYFPHAGISVQQQDANKSWRAVYHVARELNLPLKVTFGWRQKEGAAFPGMTGQFQVNWRH